MMAGTRTVTAEPPRSTAYYYADLEKIKRQNGSQEEKTENVNELSEYVESNEVINDGVAKEIPPLRDRWSPQYSTPENGVKIGETYSTAGTFPMPEPKEKEPLLAELEIVGRVPLTQLDTSSGVRRSRSWYLCCPNVGDEEISRESSWRYSSLRPVTAPPLPGQNGFNMAVAVSGGREDVATLKAERDALARALSRSRQRAAAAARAHDARLAELHGVIAELVRRRAADRRAGDIPEEEGSDECESTTQPAGELGNDADMSQTERNDNSSLLSPSELPTPLERQEIDEDADSTERVVTPKVEVSPPEGSEQCSSLMLSEKDSEICVTTARCCQYLRANTGSCDRERGSPGLLPPSPGKCESREAKVASRVRLRRTDDTRDAEVSEDEAWCVEAAERLALDVCAQADLREALVAAGRDGESHPPRRRRRPIAVVPTCVLSADACLSPRAALAQARVWRARCVRLAADCRVLDCALARAVDTAHRLSCACSLQESSSVALCSALRAADRALETYDVLLALAETQHAPRAAERLAAEAVAARVLRRLERAPAWGEPLLSPGPWSDHRADAEEEEPPQWSAASEGRLRARAAQLKRDTVALRALRPPPALYSPHDSTATRDTVSMAEMEAAVLVQEILVAKENEATAMLQSTSRSPPEPHWLDTQASETDL